MTWEEHGMDADKCKKDCRNYWNNMLAVKMAQCAKTIEP